MQPCALERLARFCEYIVAARQRQKAPRGSAPQLYSNAIERPIRGNPRCCPPNGRPQRRHCPFPRCAPAVGHVQTRHPRTETVPLYLALTRRPLPRPRGTASSSPLARQVAPCAGGQTHQKIPLWTPGSVSSTCTCAATICCTCNAALHSPHDTTRFHDSRVFSYNAKKD